MLLLKFMVKYPCVFTWEQKFEPALTLLLTQLGQRSLEGLPQPGVSHTVIDADDATVSDMLFFFFFSSLLFREQNST